MRRAVFVLMVAACCSLAIAQDVFPVRRKVVAAAAAAGGPIVFDSASGTNKPAGGTTLTMLITNTGAADRTLFASIAWDAGASACSATCDSVAMTEMWDRTHPDLGNLYYSAGYRFQNQLSGTNTIVFTLTGGTPGVIAAGAVCFSGADTNSPVRAAITNAALSANSTMTAPSATTGDIVVDALFAAAVGGITVGTDQTSRYEVDGLSAGAFSFGISTQAGVSGGVMTWTFASSYWNGGTVAFQPKP